MSDETKGREAEGQAMVGEVITVAQAFDMAERVQERLKAVWRENGWTSPVPDVSPMMVHLLFAEAEREGILDRQGSGGA